MYTTKPGSSKNQRRYLCFLKLLALPGNQEHPIFNKWLDIYKERLELEQGSAVFAPSGLQREDIPTEIQEQSAL